jgi:hypothetical protein
MAPQESSPGSAKGKWSWPDWATNKKNPCIEVYVVDDDTGEARWCHGEPQQRVQDKIGNDAYLQAEYEWDQEYYVQDFGPEHVRRQGGTTTVKDLLLNQSKDRSTNPYKGGYIAAPTLASEEDELEKTKVVRSAGVRRDQGGGVASLLDDSR